MPKPALNSVSAGFPLPSLAARIEIIKTRLETMPRQTSEKRGFPYNRIIQRGTGNS